MSQKGSKTITINVRGDVSDLMSKLKSAESYFESIENGKLKLKLDFNKGDIRSELANVEKMVKGKNLKLDLGIDNVKDLQNAMKEMEGFPTLLKAANNQLTAMTKNNRGKVKDTLSSFIKDGAQSQIDSLSKILQKNLGKGGNLGVAKFAAREISNLEMELGEYGAKAGKFYRDGLQKSLSVKDVLNSRDIINTITPDKSQLKDIITPDYKESLAQLKEMSSLITKVDKLSPLQAEAMTKSPTANIQGWINELETYLGRLKKVKEEVAVVSKSSGTGTGTGNGKGTGDGTGSGDGSGAGTADIDVNIEKLREASNIVTSLKADLQSLQNDPVVIKIDVQPTIESIKNDLNGLQNQKISLNIDLGKSLENISKLSEAFSSKDVSDYMHKMTEVSSGFRTAFANLKDATTAPSSILDELNVKAKTLKDTLSSVGVTKFKDIDKVQKQIEEVTTAQQKAADKAGDEMLNTLVKMEKDVVKQKAKVQAEAEKQAASYSEKEQADKSQKLYKTQLKNATKTLTQAKLMKDSITEIGGTREAVAKGISELQSLMPKDGTIVKPEDIANIDMATAKLKELLVAKNQIYDTKNGTLAENNFFSDITKNLSEVDPNDIRKRLNDYYKSMGKEAEKIVQKNADTYQISYRDKDMMMRDTVQIQQFANEIDGANQYATALRTVTKAESEYMTSGQKWMTGFKNKMSNLTQYMTGADILYRAAQELREGFTFVKDLNSLMTTIDQTSDITGQGLQELSQGAIDQAKNLGVAAEQVTGSIEVYAAYGQTVDSLLKKAEPTTMLAKATGADVSTSSDQILAVTKQYKELEGQESRIVNAYEKIGANIQVDFADGVNNMAEAVQVSGSVAEQAGKLMPGCTVMCI